MELAREARGTLLFRLEFAAGKLPAAREMSAGWTILKMR